MKITVMTGTEKHSATYKLNKPLLEPFKSVADIT